MPSNHWFNSSTFVYTFTTSVLISGAFVLWQLGAFKTIVYSLPRPAPTWHEYMFAVALVLLISLNIGLLRWQKKFGSCPIGTKRASGLASTLGAFALICPACVLVPFTLFGTSIILSAFTPYIPLLQIISLFLLIVSTVLLWPKQ